MQRQHILFLFSLVPFLFAAKCRKNGKDAQVVDTQAEIIEVARPESSLQVTGIDPSSIEAGRTNWAQVSGIGFDASSEVFIGSDRISSVDFRSGNSMAVAIPPVDPGTYDVRVENPDGESHTLRGALVATSVQDSIPSDCRQIVLYFSLDKSGLDEAMRTQLGERTHCFALEQVSYRVEGHADERGTTDYNIALGAKRAESLQRYLQAAGIAPGRIETISFGEERPASVGHDERSWAENRRAVVMLQE
jgi:peptidoglycan-associated lipoprotein